LPELLIAKVPTPSSLFTPASGFVPCNTYLKHVLIFIYFAAILVYQSLLALPVSFPKPD
jgi:hypothetical protein